MDRTLDTKKTGQYWVSLLFKTQDEGYALKVIYLGDWSGGQAVEMWIDSSRDDEDDDLVGWFRRSVRNDQDVAHLLGEAGFDEYTNQVSHKTPVVKMASCYDHR
jgi:hypothetical protein